MFNGYIVKTEDISREFNTLKGELNNEFKSKWGLSLDEMERKSLLKQDDLQARINMALTILYSSQNMAEKPSFLFAKKGQIFDYADYRLFFPNEDAIDKPITYCILPGYFVNEERYEPPQESSLLTEKFSHHKLSYIPLLLHQYIQQQMAARSIILTYLVFHE